MAAVAPRPSVPVVVAPRPQVPGTSGPRPDFTVVFAAAGHLVPQISHDLDVNMLLDVLVDVLAASLPIGVYDVPVDAAVVLDAVPAGVLPAGVSVATVVDVVSAAVAAAGVTAVAAVDAMSVAVVEALVEAVTVVAVDQFSIATASPSVDVPVVVDVSTVAVGGELLRDALVDVAVQVAASAVPVVAATVVASATIDSVATRIVLAAPAVDVAVQVSASVAGAVSAAALGVVTVDVATVPIVFRAVTVAPTVDVSTVSWEVASRTANVSVTPTVSTTQTSAPAFPEFVAATTTGGTSGTSRTVTLPSGTTEGDLLVMVCGGDSITFSMPSGGWTQRVNVQRSSASRMFIFTKIAGAGEGNPSVTKSAGNADVMHLLAIRGANQTNPINVVNSQYGSVASTSNTTPTVTTNVGGCLILRAVHKSAGSDHTWTWPTSTELTDHFISSTNRYALSTAAKTQESAGATGTEAASGTASGTWGGATLAIAPA